MGTGSATFCAQLSRNTLFRFAWALKMVAIRACFHEHPAGLPKAVDGYLSAVFKPSWSHFGGRLKVTSDCGNYINPEH